MKRFHIFASQDSYKNTSKNLKKFEVDGEGMYTVAAEELNEQGYEINDVWMETDSRIITNLQNPRRDGRPGRRGGYFPKNY